MFSRVTLGILAFSLTAPMTACSADAQGQPATATVVNGRPQGLFFMVRYWSYTHTLEKAAWYFSPTGEVYENLETGFSASDLAAHKGPKGTCQALGSDLQVTWSDGKVSKSQLTPDGNAFSWDMGSFTPVKPIADLKSIAGTYEGGESLSHGGNSVAVSKKLELHPDGTFRWEGVSLVQGDTADTTLYAGASGASSGTWEASGYSLTLKQSDGKVLRQIAFPYDDATSQLHPTWLFFGGTMFKRQ